MKRMAMILAAIVLLSGCGMNSVQDPVTVPSSEAMETAMISPQDLQGQTFSQEMAMLEGYLVMVDGDVRHNQTNWFAFVEVCQQGIPADVNVVHYIYTDSGIECACYCINFDGTHFFVNGIQNEAQYAESFRFLVTVSGDLDDDREPYDAYQRYILSNAEDGTDGLVIYEDLIAEPCYSGVSEIRLCISESQPPIKTYSGADAEAILSLLENASYFPCEPEEYVYCMKLTMVNGEGTEIVVELEMNSGICRYGTQIYEYGSLPDMFLALGIEQWPDAVLEEFGFN